MQIGEFVKAIDIQMFTNMQELFLGTHQALKIPRGVIMVCRVGYDLGMRMAEGYPSKIFRRKMLKKFVYSLHYAYLCLQKDSSYKRGRLLINNN